MDISNIIIKPILTEKSSSFGNSKNKKYCFYVNKKTNKVEIKQAFKSLFNVEVIDCKVINKKPKFKRTRMSSGYTSSKKKIIVTLNEGQNITLFEN